VNGKPPGFLRLLWRMAGDWLYAILDSLSKPTASERERERKDREPPVS